MFDIVVSVGLEDEKPKGGSAREQRRLRPSLAEDPSSSYAYHDEARSEKVRTSSPAPANDTHAEPKPSTASLPKPAASLPKPGFASLPKPGSASLPKPSSAKSTTASRDPLAAPPASLGNMVSPSIRTVTTGARSKPRPALSEPPEIGSWPPLPDVLDELATAGGDASRADRDSDGAPTDPPKPKGPGRQPPGGAIWGAMPPVGQVSDGEGAATVSDELAAQVDQALEARAVEVVTPSSPARDVAPEPYRDPEMKRFEPLVERGAWEQLAKELSGDAAHSAQYRLLRALAQREILPAADKAAGRLTQDAIAALAELIGVPATSPTALMLTKRLLRRNPAWTNTQPSSRLSAGIVILGLLIGTGLGWLLTRFAL